MSERARYEEGRGEFEQWWANQIKRKGMAGPVPDQVREWSRDAFNAGRSTMSSEKERYDQGRQTRDLARMLTPEKWGGGYFRPHKLGAKVFCLKRYLSNKQMPEFCQLEFWEGKYFVYNETGQLINSGGPEVPRTLINEGWISD